MTNGWLLRSFVSRSLAGLKTSASKAVLLVDLGFLCLSRIQLRRLSV